MARSDPAEKGTAAAGPAAVESALGRILNSKSFAESPRLRALLEFIVRRSIQEDYGSLKETVIGVEIFGKPNDFDPRLDACVRVAANRLRAKLRAYYEDEAPGDPIRIALPEGHYLPSFSERWPGGGSPGNPRPAAGPDSRVARAGTGTGLFVGRQAELQALGKHLARAVEGHGHMVCVVAEPGVGKTALIDAFIEAASAPGRIISAVGRCRRELEHTEPCLPWLELLEGLVAGCPSAEKILQASAPTWWSHLRFQSAAARVPQPSSAKREMLRFLKAVAESQPLVLVLEDLHWADVSTVDLIGYLGPALAPLPLLLLASYRPSSLILTGSPFLEIEPELRMHRFSEDLQLGAFSFDDTQRYFDRRFAGNEFPPELVAHLHARSGGNALCLTALVDCAVERGWLAPRDQRWVMAVPLERWDGGLPPSVHSMVDAKLAGLARCDRELLSAAAVCGANFDSAVLAAALDLDEGVVQERLASVQSAHRILNGGAELSWPGAASRRYEFAHVLYQEALANAMEPAQRRRLCSLIAGAISGLPAEAVPALIGNLARLLQEAGAREAALPYYAQAASRAVHLSAYRQALDLATQGAAIARQCVRNESVRRFEIEFLNLHALSLTAIEGFAASEIEQIYHRTRQVAQELGDLTAATSVAHLHWNLISIANLEKARELADVLWEDAAGSENREAKALARMAQGIALFHLGALAGGAVALHEAAQQWRQLEGALGFRSYMLDPAVATQCNLARALWFLGKPEEAWRTGLETVDLALEIGHSRTIAYAMALAADVAHLRRDPASAFEWSGKAIELAREHEFLYEAAWCRILQGWALAQTGGLEEAIEIFEGASQYRGPAATKYLCHFAEALGRQRRYDRALAVLDEAFRLAAARGERYYIPELERVGGEIAMRSDGQAGLERARRMLRQSAATAREFQAGSCELRAAYSLARFCLEFDPASSRQALEDLRRVAASFPETAGTPDGADARRLFESAA